VAWLKISGAIFQGRGGIGSSLTPRTITLPWPCKAAREGIHQCLRPRRVQFRDARQRLTDLKKNQIGGFQFENHSVLVSRTRLHWRGRI